MKTYSVIYVSNEPYLRQQNPLADSPHLVSVEAYNNHEREYINDAVLIITPVQDKRVYTEKEIYLQWQKLENDSWVNVPEPDFIGADKATYRRVYVTVTASASYQERVREWLIACFDEETARNIPERTLRFLEEALELAQALGMQRDEAYRMVTYVFNRPIGEPAQEFGGVMVTLAGLCGAASLDLTECSEVEYQRVINNVGAIREKHKEKQLNNITA